MTEFQHDALSSDVAKTFGLNPDMKFEAIAGNVKLAMADIGTKKDMYSVDLTKTIVLEGFNPRIKDDRYWEGIRELADSMKVHGWFPDKPLAGYAIKQDGKDLMVVVEGGRRRDAGLLLLKEMDPELAKEYRAPMVTKKNGTSALDLQYGLAQGNNNVAFRPYELAILVKRLQHIYQQTDKQVIEGLQGLVSASYLPKLQMVAGAPKEIADRVVSEELSVTEAYDLMREYGDKAVEVLTQAAAASKAAGSKKIMKKHMPGQKLAKLLVKESKPLFDMVKKVQADPGFAALSEDTRAVLEDMMRELNEKAEQYQAEEAQMLQALADAEAEAAGQTSLDVEGSQRADNDESGETHQVA
jgi:ParB family chromosome partitioning protein